MVLHSCSLLLSLGLVCCLGLLIEVLFILRVNAKMTALKKQLLATQLTACEIEDALRVKHLTVVSHLEVEVRTGASTCATTCTDCLAGNNPITRLDITGREVSIIGLKGIILANYD